MSNTKKFTVAINRMKVVFASFVIFVHMSQVTYLENKE